MDRTELTAYIGETYRADAEFPWSRYPNYAVFRHSGNKKWFAAILDVPRAKLSLGGEGTLDVVNLKCGPAMTGSLRLEPGFFPGYHMNKENWITAALDGSVSDGKIRMLLDISYDLTRPRPKKANRKLY